jgi:hypothetical protein
MKFLKAFIILTLFFNITFGQSDDRLRKIRRNYVDPALHYTVASYITFTSTMILTSINEDMNLGLKYSLSGSLTLIPVLGKELYDEKLRDIPWSWADAGFGVAGIATGLALHYLIYDKKKFKNSSFNINVGSNSATLAYRIKF